MLSYKKQNTILRYCTGVTKLDFNPFTEITNWKNLGYWLLILKPYIDKDNSANGILESYKFSPEDNSFEATVSLNATWLDGTPVSSYEAAIGIAKGITYRECFSVIKVKDTENINQIGWEKNFYKGIEIISPIKFKIYFETQIENANNLLEESLSFSSVENIIWPVRLGSSTNPNYNKNNFDIISKYPIKFENNKYILNVFGNPIELATSNENREFDFYFNNTDFNNYKKLDEIKNNFNINQSKIMQTKIAIFNSKSKIFNSQEIRSVFSNILRNIALSLAEDQNYYIAPGHFDISENGYHSEAKWPCNGKQFSNTINEIKIATHQIELNSKFCAAIDKYFSKNGVVIKWVDINIENSNVDFQILTEIIQNGRQSWIHNILNSKFIINFIENFPKTLAVLNSIAKASSKTFPVNPEFLIAFEKATFNEGSIVPIFRHYLKYYSRKNSPIILNSSENKELYFSLNKN